MPQLPATWSDVAHALMRAASRLLSTPGRPKNKSLVRIPRRVLRRLRIRKRIRNCKWSMPPPYHADLPVLTAGLIRNPGRKAHHEIAAQRECLRLVQPPQILELRLSQQPGFKKTMSVQ